MVMIQHHKLLRSNLNRENLATNNYKLFPNNENLSLLDSSEYSERITNVRNH